MNVIQKITLGIIALANVLYGSGCSLESNMQRKYTEATNSPIIVQTQQTPTYLQTPSPYPTPFTPTVTPENFARDYLRTATATTTQTPLPPGPSDKNPNFKTLPEYIQKKYPSYGIFETKNCRWGNFDINFDNNRGYVHGKIDDDSFLVTDDRGNIGFCEISENSESMRKIKIEEVQKIIGEWLTYMLDSKWTGEHKWNFFTLKKQPEKQSVWFNGPYNSGIIVTKENYGTLEVKFDEKILHIPINSSDGYFLKGLSQDVKENPEILKKPEACIIINDPRNIFPWPNVTDCVLFFSAAQLYGKDDFKLMVVDPTQPKEIDLSTSPLTLAQNDDNTSSNLLISSEKLDLGPLKPIYLKRVEEALNSGSSYIVDNRVIGIIDLSSIPKDSVVYFSNEQFSQIREIGDKILRDELKIATMYNISNKGKLNKVLLSNIGDGVVPDEILKECSYYLIFKGVSFESSDNKLEIKGLNGFKEVLVGIKNVQGMSKYLTKMRNEEGECYYPSN